MLNFDNRKNKILLLKSLTWMIRITQCRVPHASMEAMQLMPRPASDEAFPDAHLTPWILHCSGATAAWRAVLVTLHGVTSGPATSHGIEIWCPVYDHATQWGWEYTLQYCSQDNSRVSTDCGLLTRYMHGGAFDDTFKALCTSWFAFMAVLTQQCELFVFG